MSRLGELVLRAYAGVLPNRPSKSTSANSPSYHQWQYKTSAAMFASLPNLDFHNKRVLELGCGLGGRAVWLARNGALEVLGIDINAAEIGEASLIRDEFYPDVKNLAYYHCKEDEPLTSVRLPPAEPGASLCEPLEAA